MAEKTEVQPATGKMQTGSGYKIVGLKDADKMPVSFGGMIYDLKSLSDEDAELLIKAKYPHLIKA